MSQTCQTRTSHDSFDHLVDGREKPGEKTYAERVLSRGWASFGHHPRGAVTIRMRRNRLRNALGVRGVDRQASYVEAKLASVAAHEEFVVYLFQQIDRAHRPRSAMSLACNCF